MKLSKFNIRFEKGSKVAVLLIVLAIEVAFAAYLWRESKPGAVLGFLVKSGRLYHLVWKNENSGYETQEYASIEEALRFAREELLLKIGTNPVPQYELEHLWMQDRFGSYIVLWKTVGLDFLNQITFHKREDALFFANSFRRGGYSPSPYGHSVLLMPVRGGKSSFVEEPSLVSALASLWR